MFPLVIKLLSRYIFKGWKICLNASLKRLLFKAQINGFKVIASKYKILRLGRRMYLILNWLVFSFLPLGGSNAVMKVTIVRGVKHANAENTMTATVLAARISVRRLCDTASSMARIRQYCLMEMVKIHACVKSITPLGTKTVNDIRAMKWGTIACNWLSSGIMLCWRQPYISWSNILPSLCRMCVKTCGKAPSSAPAIQSTAMVASVRFLVTKVGYL